MSRYRPSGSMLVALLALVMATTGSAVAASLITSKQIKDGTITAKDINKKALKSFKGKTGNTGAAGATGPQGPVGPKGADGAAGAKGDKGDTGPRGPSDSFGSTGGSNQQIGTIAAPLVVTSVTLPAGDYVLMATTGLTNISAANRSAWCTLNDTAGEVGRTRADDISSQKSADATVLGHVSLASGDTVKYQCYADGTGVYIPSQSTPAIEAIRVATATTQ